MQSMKAINVLKTLALMFLVISISIIAVEAKDKRWKGKIKFYPLTEEITKEIIYRANHYGLEPLLVMEIMRQESSFNPLACSSANAKGLMQFIPSTAKRFGITDPHNVSQSIDAGCRYLAFLIRKFNGRLDLVLAGYNAGEGAVEKYGNRVPPYEETQKYVKTIIANYKRALQVKEAFLKGNGIVVSERGCRAEIVTYKSIPVISKKALSKREVQKKLDELNNFSTAKDRLVAVKEVN